MRTTEHRAFNALREGTDMTALQYVFEVEADKDPRTSKERWRWTLLKAGSIKIRSTMTFGTEQECREDAAWNQDEICKAPIVTVAA